MKTTKSKIQCSGMSTILALALALVIARSASATLKDGWFQANIGSFTIPGTSSYDDGSGIWTVESGICSELFERSHHFVYTSLEGDGEIIAHLRTLPQETGYGYNAGVMICEDTSTALQSVRHGLCHKDSAIRSVIDYIPRSTGGVDSSSIMDTGGKLWLRLKRTGNTFISYLSSNGSDWEEIDRDGQPMDKDVYIGIWVKSGLVQLTTQFDNVMLNGNVVSGTGGPDNDWTVFGNNMYSNPTGSVGIGTQNPRAKLDVVGKIRISKSSGEALVELGEGLDYAEGFNLSYEKKVEPGFVVIIDPANPGKLVMSDRAYDRKVAGIVAGGNGLGSGVRLGVGQFDCSVALAGRVYCNVDAIEVSVQPGDLLTTSDRPGYAMKAVDYARAQGAILGKAMQKLEKGKKGQILVLVTLQ